MHRLPLRSIFLAGALALTTAAGLQAQRADATDSQRLAAACNRFAQRLHVELARAGTPTCSPGSIAMVLHMLLPGARGKTAEQLAAALQLPEDLRGRRLLAATAGLIHDRNQTMTVRNDIWVQQGIDLVPDYTDLLMQTLHVRPRLLDFRSDADAARKVINAYIAKATNQRIKKLLRPDHVTPDTLSVLTNAMWFKDAWTHPFSASATKDLPFTLADGTTAQVPTMRTTEMFGHLKTDDWTCVALGFKNSSMRFEVIMPHAGKSMARAEAALLQGKHLDKIGYHKLQLQLPKFRTAARHELRNALLKLGVRDAFVAGDSDFTGIEANNRMKVADVVHQTWIQVDEKGCEAAAATAVVLKVGAAMQQPRLVKIDRPFAFALRDTKTGLIWTVGRVDDPRTNP